MAKGTRILAAFVGTFVLLAMACNVAAPAPAPASAPTPEPTRRDASAAPTAVSRPPVVAAATPTSQPVVERPSAPKTSPSTAPKYGGVLRTVSQSDNKGNLDPLLNDGAVDAPWVGPLYQELIRENPLGGDPVIVGDLARKWDVSPDGRTYTFHLLEDAQFHDGAPVTATDVEYTLRRVMGEIEPGPHRRAGQDVKRAVEAIRIVDPRTIEIRTKSVLSTFLPLLASSQIQIVPKHVTERLPNKTLAEGAIGSGPFKYKEWTRGVGVFYERNPKYRTAYRDGLPYLDGWRLNLIADTNTMVAALVTQKINMWPRFPGMTKSQVDAVQRGLGDRVQIDNSSMMMLARSMVRVDRPPFDNPLVRKAVWMSIDRQKVFDLVYDGRGIPGAILDPRVFPGAALSAEELKKFPGLVKPDYPAAKDLLKKAGYPNGVEIPECLTRKSDVYPDAAAVLIESLRNAGITCKKHLLAESIAGTRQVQRGEFWWYTYVHTGYLYVEPANLFLNAYLRDSGGNYSGAPEAAGGYDPVLDKLYEQYLHELNPSLRNQTVRDMQVRVFTEMTHPTIVVGLPDSGYAWLSIVKGYRTPPGISGPYRFDTVWLNQ